LYITTDHEISNADTKTIYLQNLLRQQTTLAFTIFFNESILKKYKFSKYIYKKSLKKASSSICPDESCLTMDK